MFHNEYIFGSKKNNNFLQKEIYRGVLIYVPY